MIRSLLVLIVVVAVACGGGGADSGPTPPNPMTAQTWSRWATEAQQIAVVTGGMYQSGTMQPSQATEQQARARALAEEIRATDPSSELVLNVASDLDELVEALEFGLEYARNVDLPVIRIAIPTLVDALNQLAEDATALGETLETP